MWKRIIIIAVLILVLLAITFVSQTLPSKEAEAPLINQEEQEDAFVEPLTIKHQYKDGMHTFVGDIELPTPCYAYNAFIEDTDDEKVKNIVVEYQKDENIDSCVQVITTANFRIAYEGPEDLQFNLLENGQPRRLNMYEIPDHVDIDQFEIFLKG